MKKSKNDANGYVSIPLSFLFFLLKSKTDAQVDELMLFEYSEGTIGYYVCPACKTTIEREFMCYCDRCGQKLGWKKYKKAKIVYPGKRKP